MSDKKPGITMASIAGAKPATEAPKIKKPAITTNKVNAPAPAPRVEGPIVRGPMITTHDEPPKTQTEAQVIIEGSVPGVVEPIPASETVPGPVAAPEATRKPPVRKAKA